MKKYHIYHIEGVKIGCSDNPKKRVNLQGYTEYTILETHDDIITASIRERELQKEWGYKVDNIPYYQTLNNATYEGRSKGGTIVGNNNITSGLLKSIRGLGGKISGNKMAIENPEHFKRMSLLGSEKGANATKYKQEYAILVYKYNTGEYVGEYPNQTEASKQLHLHTQNIGQVLLGHIKQSGGYTFNYKNKKAVL